MLRIDDIHAFGVIGCEDTKYFESLRNEIFLTAEAVGRRFHPNNMRLSPCRYLI